jgi:4-hydroxybenzoyl-CoA thioesterase
MAVDALFRRERVIRFSDCDPAGIVFYPQYFVMFNALVEDWFSEGLAVGWGELLFERRIGVPTVRLEVDFSAVSRMGDEVVLSLAVERLGRRSLTLALRCESNEGQLRVAVRQVLVTTSLDSHRAVDIPADIRAAVARTTASRQ